jgi:hypothetical protein
MTVLARKQRIAFESQMAKYLFNKEKRKKRRKEEREGGREEGRRKKRRKERKKSLFSYVHETFVYVYFFFFWFCGLIPNSRCLLARQVLHHLSHAPDQITILGYQYFSQTAEEVKSVST